MGDWRENVENGMKMLGMDNTKPSPSKGVVDPELMAAIKAYADELEARYPGINKFADDVFEKAAREDPNFPLRGLYPLKP